MNDKNKRDDIKIDIISELDEDIVSRNTEKRFELFMKLATQRKKNKKVVVAWISAAASFLLIFGILIAVIIPTLTKQMPIYQGMTVSDKLPTPQSAAAENLLPNLAPVNLSFTNPIYVNPYNLSTGNGAPNEEHKGEEAHRPGEIVVDEVKDSLNIVGGEKSIYYAEKNQDIYITVHISNPDSFEILSFTLNGKKYSSYMFEEGSDMENLILKLNVGEAEGIVEYTIDAIKYIDGETTRDVRMEGDKTVKVGVATEKQPAAVISEEKIGFNDISFKVTVTDELKLIERSGGRMAAAIIKGEELVAYREIFVGEETEIVFDGLEVNTEYTYGVAAFYDAFDGSGMNGYILASKTFTTLEALMFDGIEVSHTGIKYSLVWHDDYTEREIVSVTLYKGEEKIKDLEITETLSVDELLSNNEYTIIVEYKNDGGTTTTYLNFKTKYDFGVGEWEPSKGLEITDGVITGIGSCTDTVLFIDKSVGNSAFKYSAAIEQVYIYCDEETYIGDEAFYGCNNLTNVTVANGVTNIGKSAFYYCTSLTSVNIGSSVTSIGQSAFGDCEKLVEVINRSSLEITAGDLSYGQIGYYAKEVHTGESKIVNKDGYLFYTYNGVNYLLGYAGKDIKLIFPDDFNGEKYEVYRYAFAYCEKSMSITMSDGVTNIGEKAFYWCKGLESITISGSIKNIGRYVFCNCTGLKSVTILYGVEGIGSGAFSGCWPLSSVTIPESVTSIGGGAFSDCLSLRRITIPKSVKTMGGSVFDSDSITYPTTVYLSAGCDTTAWENGWEGTATVVQLKE